MNLPESDEYYRIPGYPDHLSSTAVLARMLDGLGFRFYWATEGLRARVGDIMSIGELAVCIWQLMNWVSTDALKTRHYRNPKDGPDAREQTLVIIHDLKAAILALNNEVLSELHFLGRPFWHIITGPFSDALTHTGQINSFRRLNGNP